MSRISQKIFLDSSFFLGFIDRANLNHQKAITIMEFIGRQNYYVYTSNLVVLQTYARIERDLGGVISLEFLQSLLESSISILYPSKSEMLASFRYIKANPVRQVSLTEIVNSIMMEKNDVSTILTFDFWHNLMGTKVSTLINP